MKLVWHRETPDEWSLREWSVADGPHGHLGEVMWNGHSWDGVAYTPSGLPVATRTSRERLSDAQTDVETQLRAELALIQRLLEEAA